MKSIKFTAIALFFFWLLFPVLSYSKTFTILLISHHSEDSTDQYTDIIIAGGNYDGLTVGMTGIFRDFLDPESLVVEGTIQIISVDDYLSTCRINSVDSLMISLYGGVEIELPEISFFAGYNLGIAAMNENNYLLASHFFQKAQSLDSTNVLVNEQLITCDQKQTEKEDQEFWAYRKDGASEGTFNFWISSALHLIIHDNYFLAQKLYRRAKGVSSYNLRVLSLGKSLRKHVFKNYVKTPSPTEFVPVRIQPEMIHEYRSPYPLSAKKQGDEGIVWLKVLIDEDGDVIDAIVAKTSGVASINKAALYDAFRNKFSPAIQDGKPVKIWATYNVEYKLN